MIPFVARVSVRHKRRDIRIWVPLALIWLLLLPVVLLLLPLFILGCMAGRVSPWRALAICWDILCSTQGSEIEVDNAATSFSIYVF